MGHSQLANPDRDQRDLDVDSIFRAAFAIAVDTGLVSRFNHGVDARLAVVRHRFCPVALDIGACHLVACARSTSHLA